MAKPDTDDGWLKYAHELDAALAVADFSKGARIVLRKVFAQIFGPAKLKVARISPTEIADATGQHKQHVGRAVRELVESNVLVRLPDGLYRFNKDYESWLLVLRTKEGSQGPRLSPCEVNWCRQEAKTAMSYGGKTEPPVAGESVTQNGYSSTNNEMPGNQSGLPFVTPNGYELSPKLVTPHIGNGRAEFKNSEKEDILPLTHANDSRSARSPEDLAAIADASRFLEADLESHHLALELGRNINVASMLSISGPAFLYAAKKVTSPEATQSQRRSWRYFLGIAKTASADEINPPQKVRKPTKSQAADSARADLLKKLHQEENS